MPILSTIQRYEPNQNYLVFTEHFQINEAEGLTYTAILLLLLTAIVLGAKYKRNNDKLTKQNARLIADNAVHEVEVLKEKLKPHALKNTLAYMKASISGLNKSINSLSEVLDYILYGANGHFVSPKEEVEFLKNLLSFHAIRLEQIDIKPNIDVDVHSIYYSIPCIPHLVSAYFVENALKHGDTKADDFLNVNVSLAGNEFHILVKNKLKKGSLSVEENKKGGIGLVNLEKRLNLLSTKHSIKTETKSGYFISELNIKLHA